MSSLNKNELRTIGKIAIRAHRLLGWDNINVIMDVATVHEEACPLRLEALLHADDFELSHDIMGMNRNLDHMTHKLNNNFTPRFSAN